MRRKLLFTATLLMATAPILSSIKYRANTASKKWGGHADEDLDIQVTKDILVGFFRSLETKDQRYDDRRKGSTTDFYFMFTEHTMPTQDHLKHIQKNNLFMYCWYTMDSQANESKVNLIGKTQCICDLKLAEPGAIQLIEEALAQVEKERNEKNTKS